MQTDELRCPVDGTPLRALRNGGYGCGQCWGAWFPYQAVTRVLGHIAKPDPKSAAAQSTRRCPVHDAPLLTARHRKGPEVNVCLRCGGVWLDAGELQQIVAPAPPVFEKSPAVATTAAVALAATGDGKPAELPTSPPAAPKYRPGSKEEVYAVARANYREGLENPKLGGAVAVTAAFLGIPLFLMLVVALSAVLQKHGLHASPTAVMEIILALVSAAMAALFGWRHEIPKKILWEEWNRHAKTLDLPLLAETLSLLEGVAVLPIAFYGGAALVVPIGSHFGPDTVHGMGFAAVLWWCIGAWTLLSLGMGLCYFTAIYLQDRYVPRLVTDATVIMAFLQLI